MWRSSGRRSCTAERMGEGWGVGVSWSAASERERRRRRSCPVVGPRSDFAQRSAQLAQASAAAHEAAVRVGSGAEELSTAVGRCRTADALRCEAARVSRCRSDAPTAVTAGAPGHGGCAAPQPLSAPTGVSPCESSLHHVHCSTVAHCSVDARPFPAHCSWRCSLSPPRRPSASATAISLCPADVIRADGQ